MMKKWPVLLPFLLSIAIVSARAASGIEYEMSQVPAERVYQTVAGIISYSHWPASDNPPTLCVFSSAYFLSAITAPAETQKRPVFNAVVLKNSRDIPPSRCDAVYFGRESAAEQLIITERYQDHPLLTIAEQNQECGNGSAFCLVFANKTVSFAVNWDALFRTGIRVTPEVLILARPQNEDHE